MRNQFWVCGKNSASRSSALPGPGASEKSTIRVRARIVPVGWAYPVGVGMPSPICTLIAPLIMQGPSAVERASAMEPAVVEPPVR